LLLKFFVPTPCPSLFPVLRFPIDTRSAEDDVFSCSLGLRYAPRMVVCLHPSRCNYQPDLDTWGVDPSPSLRTRSGGQNGDHLLKTIQPPLRYTRAQCQVRERKHPVLRLVATYQHLEQTREGCKPATPVKACVFTDFGEDWWQLPSF
jgi:hypothetical protein